MAKFLQTRLFYIALFFFIISKNLFASFSFDSSSERTSEKRGSDFALQSDCQKNREIFSKNVNISFKGVNCYVIDYETIFNGVLSQLPIKEAGSWKHIALVLLNDKKLLFSTLGKALFLTSTSFHNGASDIFTNTLFDNMNCKAFRKLAMSFLSARKYFVSKHCLQGNNIYATFSIAKLVDNVSLEYTNESNFVLKFFFQPGDVDSNNIKIRYLLNYATMLMLGLISELDYNDYRFFKKICKKNRGLYYLDKSYMDIESCVAKVANNKIKDFIALCQNNEINKVLAMKLIKYIRYKLLVNDGVGSDDDMVLENGRSSSRVLSNRLKYFYASLMMGGKTLNGFFKKTNLIFDEDSIYINTLLGVSISDIPHQLKKLTFLSPNSAENLFRYCAKEFHILHSFGFFPVVNKTDVACNQAYDDLISSIPNEEVFNFILNEMKSLCVHLADNSYMYYSYGTIPVFPYETLDQLICLYRNVTSANIFVYCYQLLRSCFI